MSQPIATIDCKTCLHFGVCAIRQKMLESIEMRFPDGKVAIFNMEQALVACAHHTQAAGTTQPISAPATAFEPAAPSFVASDAPTFSVAVEPPPAAWASDANGQMRPIEVDLATMLPPMIKPLPPSAQGPMGTVKRRLNLGNIK